MLATLAAFAGQAAVVYKWKDSDGVVHYSDQPVPGAQKIYTATGGETGASSRARPNPDAQDNSGQREAPTAVLGYTEFGIASPVPDQTFFGDEPINVGLRVNPGIKPNHNLAWHLNGKEIQDQGPNATQFILPHLDRGTYVIAATLSDPQTGESRSTESVTFFVRQPSALSPQHQKP